MGRSRFPRMGQSPAPGVGASGEDLNGSKIRGTNILIVFYSKNGSILLSFRDITTGRTPDDGRTDVGNQRISGP